MSTVYQNSGRGCDVPPVRKHVEIYFLHGKQSIEAAGKFYAHYAHRQWRSHNGKVIQDWKRLAWQWIWNRN